MKLFSNLSHRDRSLLIVLLVIVVFYLCYSFIMVPNLEAAELLKQERAAVDSDLARARELMENRKDLEKQAFDLQKELIQKHSAFFADLDQAQILYKLDALMRESGIVVSGYAPAPELITQVPLVQGAYAQSEYPLKDLAKEISPDFYKEQYRSPQEGSAEEEAEAGQGVATNPDAIPGVDITFNFENSSYESVFAFLSAVEKMNKTTLLKSVEIEKNGIGVGGELNIAFYSLPALEEKQRELLKFVPVIPKEKANPFQ